MVSAFRPNPPGTISGRQLGDAAHRLVVNSLHVKLNSNGYGNQMHAHRPSYAEAPYYPPRSSYANNGSYDQGHHSMPPPRTFQHPQAQQRNSYHPPNGPHSQHYERNSGHAPYQSASHQNGGIVYPQRPITQGPPGVIPGPYPGGYNNYQSYQPSGPPGYQGVDAWVPQASQNMGRGYGRPQQSGNQFSGLDRRGNRRPSSQHGPK